MSGLNQGPAKTPCQKWHQQFESVTLCKFTIIMGKTYRKQFWTKFIEGDKRAHRKLRHICRCDYCMNIRKRRLQIREKQKEIKEYLDT